MQAIETTHSGYQFRSRLEARWAVFFETIGIQYEYEPEGFKLKNGTQYLPDFWLPTFDGGLYVEVKPLKGDFKKALLFAQESDHPIWLAEGPPNFRAWWVVAKKEENTDNGYEYDAARNKEHGLPDVLCWMDGIPNFDQAHLENRMYESPGYTNHDSNMAIPSDFIEDDPSNFTKAINASRAARFGT